MTTEFAKAFDSDNEEAEHEPTSQRFTDAEVVQQDEPEPQQPEQPERVQI